MDFGKPILSNRAVPGRPKAKRKRSTRADVANGQASMFDKYGHEPLRVENLMTTVDVEKSRFALDGMIFEFAPAPNDPALAMRMTVFGLKHTYLVYESWRRQKPPQTIESYISPCHWFVVSMRAKQDDGIIRASFCSLTATLTISLPHSTRWKWSGLLWFASYTYCCARHREEPRPWLQRTCDCVVD